MNPDRLGTAQWAAADELLARHTWRPGALWLGREPTTQKPIGVLDDRHACLVAGTRSGKGTSVIVPNLCLWPGSLLVVDPTGDLATLTAARRDTGVDGVVGRGQRVHVLDPYGITKVDDRYRARFNPLDLLDARSKSVVRDAEGIASSLVPPAKEKASWAQDGARRLLAGLILHVLTDERFASRRNLVTVRELVHRGDIELYDFQVRRGRGTKHSAFDLLWSAMALNVALGGHIAGTGEEFRRVSRDAPEQWLGVYDAAVVATNFINNEDMRACLASSTFSPRELKTDPRGVTVFVTIPSRHKVEDFRWLRLLVSLVLGEMEAMPSQPACGHPTLMLLDEFATLQRMERIESGIAEIAKFGVKLFIVLQNLGQLKNEYGDNWQTFLSNCGTKVFFGIDDHFTREHVSLLIGDTEVVRTTEARTQGESTNESVTRSSGRTESSQRSEGRSQGDSYQRGALGLRDTAGLFRKLAGNVQASDTHERSSSSGSSTEHGSAEGRTTGRESSTTRTEHIHKRPLVTPDEVGKLFRRIERDENSPLYPGMAIGLLSSHPDPVMIRRTQYFEDEAFAPFGFAPAPSAAPPKAAQATPPVFAACAVPLPLAGVVVRILNDQRTAIVGGTDGRIAAIDLRSGAVLDTASAFEPPRYAPGGGEVRYVADRFFFLERAPAPGSFFTMDHSGELKTWIFDGRLRQDGVVELLRPHVRTLRERIAQAKRGGGWSHWTVYSGELPADVPRGIVMAKLTPDGSSIVCLTDWFAIFRCDLAGRLRDAPNALADAFAIEPANADGSQVWIGRGSTSSVLYRLDLPAATVQAHAARGSFGNHGIHVLSAQALDAGGVTLGLPALAPMEAAELTLPWGHRPLVISSRRQVLGVSGSMISVYDQASLRRQGDPLVAGHEGEIRDMDATADGLHAVSVSARTLRVWDLDTRAPVGGYPADELLRHGLYGAWQPPMQTRVASVYYRGYGDSAALIDLRHRKVTRITSTAQDVGTAQQDDGELHLLSLATRPGAPPTGMRGVLGRVLKVPPPDQHLLRHHVVRAGRATELATVVLAGARLDRCQPLPDNTVALDLGQGRVALLTAGHLALYDTRAQSIVAGPIDISGPVDAQPGPHAEWTYYSQLAASPDYARLFVRGRHRAIKVFSAINLAPLGAIARSEGRLGLLAAWSDSRHVLFSIERSANGDTSVVLCIADSATTRVLGTLGTLRWTPWEGPNSAVVFDAGKRLALIEGADIGVIDLTCGDYLAQPLGAHADSINSIHLVPGVAEILSTSQDGSARFWALRDFSAPAATPPEAVLARFGTA